jgi:hypothetical protein
MTHYWFPWFEPWFAAVNEEPLTWCDLGSTETEGKPNMPSGSLSL